MDFALSSARSRLVYRWNENKMGRERVEEERNVYVYVHSHLSRLVDEIIQRTVTRCVDGTKKNKVG